MAQVQPLMLLSVVEQLEALKENEATVAVKARFIWAQQLVQALRSKAAEGA